MSNILSPYLSRNLYKISTSQILLSLSFGSLRVNFTCIYILYDQWIFSLRWIGWNMRNSCYYTFCYLCKSMAFLYETWHSNNPINPEFHCCQCVYLFYIINISTVGRFLQRCFQNHCWLCNYFYCHQSELFRQTICVLTSSFFEELKCKNYFKGAFEGAMCANLGWASLAQLLL